MRRVYFLESYSRRMNQQCARACWFSACPKASASRSSPSSTLLSRQQWFPGCIAIPSRSFSRGRDSGDDNNRERSKSGIIPELASLQSFANLDHDRRRRTGFPEAVFAEGKTAAQVAAILEDMARKVNDDDSRQTTDDERQATSCILATRVTPNMHEDLCEFPFAHGTLEYHAEARIVVMRPNSHESNRAKDDSPPRVVVATAGTTDLPVAEEAAVTLEASGCQVDRVYDAGVAGLHRIVRALPRLRHPDIGCVIVCAGMDGALPSVVGGLVEVPVVAVPTSIGYGASLGGVSALLTMLNTCSPGVGVVNIDNGFGAAALAYKIIQRRR